MPSSPEPVLLLHGQPGGARDWDRVVAALEGRARTIAVTRPGWDGRSTATDLKGNAAAAVAALDAHGVERATIVGHSFGGSVAAWLATEYPERVQAIVLAAPAANVASLYRLDHWLAAPVTGYLAGAATLGGLGLMLGARPSRQRIAARTGVEENYLGAAGSVLRSPSAWRSFVIEQRSLIADLPALEERLGQISAPTRILIGTADRIVPAASARRLAGQIPGAELVLLERAGHLLPLQHARRLAEMILTVADTARPNCVG